MPSTSSLLVAASSSSSAIAVVKGPLRRGCTARQADALAVEPESARRASPFVLSRGEVARSSRRAWRSTPASARVALADRTRSTGAAGASGSAGAASGSCAGGASSEGGAGSSSSAATGSGGLRGMAGLTKLSGRATYGVLLGGTASRRAGSGSLPGTPVPKLGLGMLTPRGIFTCGISCAGGMALGLGLARPSSLAWRRRKRRSSGMP